MPNNSLVESGRGVPSGTNNLSRTSSLSIRSLRLALAAGVFSALTGCGGSFEPPRCEGREGGPCVEAGKEAGTDGDQDVQDGETTGDGGGGTDGADAVPSDVPGAVDAGQDVVVEAGPDAVDGADVGDGVSPDAADGADAGDSAADTADGAEASADGAGDIAAEVGGGETGATDTATDTGDSAPSDGAEVGDTADSTIPVAEVMARMGCTNTAVTSGWKCVTTAGSKVCATYDNTGNLATMPWQKGTTVVELAICCVQSGTPPSKKTVLESSAGGDLWTISADKMDKDITADCLNGAAAKDFMDNFAVKYASSATTFSTTPKSVPTFAPDASTSPPLPIPVGKNPVVYLYKISK